MDKPPKNCETVATRIVTLPAESVVSPIFQSYFGFASVFNDTDLTGQEAVEQEAK